MIAPRKVRLVVNLIRGKKAQDAETLLEFLTNRASKSVLKLLKSAIVSAKNNFQLESSNLYISKIFVDEGPKLKRWRPVSRGSAHPIWKRGSHITLVLTEIKPTPLKKIKKRGKKETRKEQVLKPKGKPEEVKPELADLEPRVKKEEPAFPPKPRFVKEESKKQKSLRGLKRIFRRKAF